MRIIEDHVLEVGSRHLKRVVSFGLLDDGRYVHFPSSKSGTRIISTEEFKEIERTGVMKSRSSLS